MDKNIKNYHQLCRDYSEESKQIDTTEATPFFESLRYIFFWEAGKSTNVLMSVCRVILRLCLREFNFVSTFRNND